MNSNILKSVRLFFMSDLNFKYGAVGNSKPSCFFSRRNSVIEHTVTQENRVLLKYCISIVAQFLPIVWLNHAYKLQSISIVCFRTDKSPFNNEFERSGLNKSIAEN